ncbi:cilia- and flagella-associated protein 44 [Cylas formicarius]|uniref:cilia- and flagella-associated protein 44 n=1 Tax=Cylas formicarius TaxID=197179 RepID=UPI0029586B28|nr:cilia- and flagella-associated protein 44 [Cylas formicarius]
MYDSNKFISGSRVGKRGTLNQDLLQFDFSYGYDCRKYFNLTVLDENTVTFSSGNFIIFLDVKSKETVFRRSALGGGIGHIQGNPNTIYPHFSVAECGTVPIIITYVWPTLEVVCVLKGGAERIYSNIDFNPNGDLLVSQSGDPDYLITVWDWRNHTILLRTKSYINDVYRVKFSPYVAGQLTTCGVAHIKFWKMARTFTGLKLQGELGRFGKTEYSDVVGVLPMPDTKVVSGCEWGNILVWDDGLITFEVFRSLRRRCHDAPIVQFFYNEGELWTVSMDGHVKVWWFEKIDQADPPEDDRVVLIDPTYDFYTPGLMLMSVEKRREYNPSCSEHFAQDGNGGIWLIDLNTEKEPKPSEQLFKCHAGRVADIAACPYGPYLASLGEDGRIFLYDYLKRSRVFEYTFPAGGVCLIWPNLDVVPFGDTILAGFEDGQIRVCCLTIPDSLGNRQDSISLAVAQITKPHNKKLTTMAINRSGTLLVTAAEDNTFFVFKTDLNSHKKCLTPIGFFLVPDAVNCISWHYENEHEVLLGCEHGHMMQVALPKEEQLYTTVSFRLNLEPKFNRFTTYKSQIKRDIKIKEIEERKAKKVARKRQEMEALKNEHPGLEIDEETFLEDSESEEELEPLYIPEVPNRIIWLKYTENDTIWISMAGYDAGYIYEYHIDQKSTVPIRFRMVEDAEDLEISTYVYSHKKDFLIFAMQDGSVRVNKRNPNDFADLKDYFTISMHDNQNGFIPRLCFSYDERYFFSCGHDGNVFSYKFHPTDYSFPITKLRRIRTDHTCSSIEEIETTEKPSLEETKIKAENDRIFKVATERKTAVREALKILKERYKKLLHRNTELLPSQSIPREQLEPDDRVSAHLKNVLDEKIEIVKRKLGYDVEKSRVKVNKLLSYITDPCDMHPNVIHGIGKPGCAIMTVRQRIMPPIFYEMLRIIDEKLKQEESKGRSPERVQIVQKPFSAKIEKTESPLEFFLLSLPAAVVQDRLGPQLTRILKKYRARKEKWERRAKEWDEFLAKKPVPGKNHPDDEKFLEEAKHSFGDYKLKENFDYKVSTQETTIKHYKKLLETRGKQYALRHNFIRKVYDIRDEKYKLIELLKKKQKRLDEINEELPEYMRKNGPDIPPYDAAEFPEEKLKIKVVLPEGETESDDVDQPKERKIIAKPVGDILEKQLLASKTYPKFDNGFFISAIPNEEVFAVQNMSCAELLQFSEHSDTPFESCLRANRLNRLLFYQKLAIAEMEEMIEDFNNWIFEARKERLPILIGGNFIDIFIVCLNEELQILKSCEEQEEKLLQEVNSKLSGVHAMEDIIEGLKYDKTAHETKLENYRIEEEKIQEKFKNATENNKFFDFLRKVFRKKFRLPRIKSENDDTSESSTSSTDDTEYDGDTASVDSRDFGFIKQDLNVCPKGCEPALFNLTVELRTKKHKLEQNEKNEIRLLESTTKEIEINKKKLITLQNDYKLNEEKLEEFRREKQKKLNDVRCTVVLHLDQIYEFNPESSDISDFIVFSRSQLTDLYRQVDVLKNETLKQQISHDTYLAHLMRLGRDTTYMKRKLRSLKLDIIQLLKTKFGKIVDIDELELAMLQRSFQKQYVNELEEVVLKKLVYNLRIKMTDIKAMYLSVLDDWDRKIAKAQEELADEIKQNTKRVELIAVINREKEELAKFVRSQQTKREKIESTEAVHKEFLKDLLKLESIVEEQNRTLHELREETKMLKVKGLPPKSTRKKVVYLEDKEKHEVEESKEQERPPDWEYFDEFINEEIYDEGAKSMEKVSFKREITIPGFYSLEEADIIEDLVECLTKDVDQTLIQKSKETITRKILSSVADCTSVTEIVNEIMNSLPLEFTEEQQKLIKKSADQLLSIQDAPQINDEHISSCMKDILDDIVADVFCSGPASFMTALIEQLLENLPLEYLKSNETIDKIVIKVKQLAEDIPLDKEEIRKSIDKLPIPEKSEVMDIVNAILERVYGEGIDYFLVNP